MVAKTLKKKIELRIKRKKRVRAKISGIPSKPRISIFRSNRTIYAQAIDDVSATTLCASNGGKLGVKANVEGAKVLGADIAAKLKTLNITEALFDRNGYLYHGVIAAFAQSVRDNGIKL